MWMVAVVGLSAVFGVARLTLPAHGLQKRDVFKDLAHLWVGGLFGAAIASGQSLLWWAAGGLTVLEVVAFIGKNKVN